MIKVVIRDTNTGRKYTKELRNHGMLQFEKDSELQWVGLDTEEGVSVITITLGEFRVCVAD